MESFWIGCLVSLWTYLLLGGTFYYLYKWWVLRTTKKAQKIKRELNKVTLETPHHNFEIGDTVYFDYSYQIEKVDNKLYKESCSGKVVEILWPSGLNEEGKYREACYGVKPFVLPAESATWSTDIKGIMRYEHDLSKYIAKWE